jgi:hypothetical protein
MTRHELKSLIERVEALPPERQAQIAQIVEEIEAQVSSRHRLDDEQVAEIERRLADPQPRFVSLAEARVRLRRPNARMRH